MPVKKFSGISRFLRYAFFASFYLFLVSCEKEKDYADPCSDPLKIRQVKSADLIMEEVFYTADCRVHEYIQAFSYKKFSYNAKHQLVKVEQSVSLDPTSCFMQPGTTGETYTDPRKAKITQHQDFTYNDVGSLVMKRNYFRNGDDFQLASYQVYETGNELVSRISRYNPQDELTEINIYSYDGKGNMVRDEYYTMGHGTEPRLMGIQEFSFDDRTNPYKIFSGEGIPGKYTNLNNILKNTYTDAYSEEEYVYTNEFTYEYNASGYPLKINNLDLFYSNQTP